jgi:CheY-like chemotaxis protein/nitrogen-specific signal transduction histidine kinase
VVRAGVIARDVTERNKALRDVARARDQALDASRLKSAFLSNMSHEIRTPLNVIMGFGEIIAGHLAGMGDRSKDEEIEAIRRNGRRLMDTIQGILDFSKMEVGAFELNPKPIRLSGMVARQVRDLNVLAARKGLVLSARIDGAASVWFDEYCLAGALTNLIQNAIKFTDSGEVRVRLYRDASGFPCLDISDTGIGIRQEYMSRLFEPFMQASSGYTRRFEGSGLGLALTSKYLEMNGARLSASSQPGKGSRFTITFSRESDTGIHVEDIGEDAATQPEPRATAPPPPACIMLVEDDPDTVRYMTSILSKHYRVLTVDSADGVRKGLASTRPDLILMDLTLKGDEDGLMVTRDLKTHQEWKDIPVIAVTAYARAEDRDAALAAGCYDHLSKPVSGTVLIEKIASTLLDKSNAIVAQSTRTNSTYPS